MQNRTNFFRQNMKTRSKLSEAKNCLWSKNVNLCLLDSVETITHLSRGSCRKQWKGRSMPLVPHVIELCSTLRELIGCPMLKSMI